MAKLYPPYIEGSIPAFYGEQLTVPYEMNKTVGQNDISGFQLKIITVSTNKTIGYVESSNFDINKKEVIFIMPVDKLMPSQFYKIQLAYLDKNKEVGFYSTVGVVKYCAEPKISIDNLTAGTINLHQYTYLGVYELNNKDPMEKEAYYQFDVYDYNNNLYYSTGKKIHNATIEEIDAFDFTDTLESNQTYQIQYTVWTINNLKISTKRYRIMQRESLPLEMNAALNAELNFEEGYIELTLKDLNKEKQYVSGAFVLTRASEEDNYKSWNEIYNFELRNQSIANRFLTKDFTVKQGIKYKYAIQQYNGIGEGLYSNPLISNEIKADFEDMFLFDGERQLKIRFNGKMNTFKTSLLEQKVNTIGNKYPFIFRNGNVAYKEFPLNGLISYLSDEENLFMTDFELKNQHRHSTPSLEENISFSATDLIGENYTNERKFKIAVLDWLNDGNPKIFRSPSEGNFIVRLLNTSLSPEVALGRMLHNFSCTAYEIADFNYKNMLKYNFIKLTEKERFQMKWETIDLSKYKGQSSYLKQANKTLQAEKALLETAIILNKPQEEINSIIESIKQIEYEINKPLNDHPAITVKIVDMRPGEIILIDGQEVKIGVNGSLYLNLGHPIETIHLCKDAETPIGLITYSYYGNTVNQFKLISDVHLEEVPLKRIEGPCEDLFKKIEDIRTSIVRFYNLCFYRRFDYFDNKIGYLADGEHWRYPVNVEETLEGIEPYTSEEKDFLVYINNNPISIKEIGKYEVENFDNIKSISFGEGVICECSYQTKIKTFNIEETDADIIIAKENWKEKLEEYQDYLLNYDSLIRPYELKVQEIDYKKQIYPELLKNLKKEKNLIEEEYTEYKRKADFLLITLNEAIEYINNKKNDINTFSVRDNINEEIEKNIRLAQRENDITTVTYWTNIKEYFKEIKKNYPISQYLFKDGKNIYNTTPNSYPDSEFLKDENGNETKKHITPTGFEMNIQPLNWDNSKIEVGNVYPIAFYAEDDSGYGAEIEDGSLWVDPNDKIKEPYYSFPGAPNNDDLDNTKSIYVDVFSYFGTTDPDHILLDVDIWIDTTNDGDASENELNKGIDIFRYCSEDYKDIAYYDNKQEKYLSAILMRNNKNYESSTEFEPERYIFRLDTNYYLYQIRKREELIVRRDVLRQIQEQENRKLTDEETWEINYLESLLNNSTENYLDYFRPVTLEEISNGSITIAHATEDSLHLKFEDLDLIFTTAINLNNYYYYKTQDIWKIKEYIDKINELTNEIKKIDEELKSYEEEDSQTGRTPKEEALYQILQIANKLDSYRSSTGDNSLSTLYNIYLSALESKGEQLIC